MLSLGILIVANKALRGRWRWLPIGLIVGQLPFFIVGGAIGEGVGSEEVADGLGPCSYRDRVDSPRLRPVPEKPTSGD